MNAEFHEQWREKFAAVIEALRFIVNKSEHMNEVEFARGALEALANLGFKKKDAE